MSVRTNWSTTQLLALEGVKDVRVEKEQTVLTLEDEHFAQSIFDQLSNGKYIEKFSLDYLTLDEIFKDKVGGSVVEV